MPGRPGRLISVTGIAIGDALANADQALGRDLEQDALPVGNAAERGLERRHQGHAKMMKGDLFDAHRMSFSPGLLHLQNDSGQRDEPARCSNR